MLSTKETIVGNNKRSRHSELILTSKETLLDKKEARGICKDNLVEKLSVTYLPVGSSD